jgi:hypothetical protein
MPAKIPTTLSLALPLCLRLSCGLIAGLTGLAGLPGSGPRPAEAAEPAAALIRPATQDEAPVPALPVERLSPQVRMTPLDALDLPPIPASAVSPFLAGVRVTDEAGSGLPGAQPVSALAEGHRVAGIGEHIYVGDLGAGTDWDIYRRGAALIDPASGERLATELVPIGQARLVRSGNPATLVVRSASREVGVGDLVVPHADATIALSYRPLVPVRDIDAQVMSIYGGRAEQSELGAGLAVDRPGAFDFERRREAGPLQVITLNRGRDAGLEPGHVLALHRSQRIDSNRSIGPYYLGERRRPPVDLPDERYGLIFVFRTFEHVSYALVVRGERSAAPGDHARNP